MNSIDLQKAMADAQSPDEPTRGRALQDLSLAVQTQPQWHARAMSVFQAALLNETTPWPLVSAVRGIERIVGSENAHDAWMILLRHKSEAVVAQAVISLTDRWYVPELLSMLDRPISHALRINVICALGLLHDKRAVDPVIGQLNHPEVLVQAYAIRTLGMLGEARAIGRIEPYLASNAPTWPIDNHGPMVPMHDVAAEAIAAIGRGSPGPVAASSSPIAHRPVAKPVSAVARPVGRGSVFRTLAVYVPLAASILEIPLLFIVVGAVRESSPDLSPRQQTQQADVVCAIPLVMAMLVALIFAWPRFFKLRWWEKIALVAGSLGCGAIIVALALEYQG